MRRGCRISVTDEDAASQTDSIWSSLCHGMAQVRVRLPLTIERRDAMRSLSLSVFLMASAAMLAPLLVALAYTASVLASALMFP